MRICVCGGGNLGHVCAAFLANRGNEVTLLTRKPEQWRQTLDIVAPDGDFKGQLAGVTNRAETAVGQAELVLVCLPGYAIRPELEAIKPWLPDGCIVGTVVASTGFFFEAQEVLSHSTTLFGLQRVPFISRIINYGQKAELKGYKDALCMTTANTDNQEEVRATVEQLFERPTRLAKSHYEVSLSNSNPLLHPSRTYTMWNDWKPGTVYQRNPQFYAEWTPEASVLLLKMDAEFQHLLDVLGVEAGSIPTILDYYESTDALTLTHKIQTIKAFQNIASPMKAVEGGFVPDFSSRYFTEDFPYGMRYIVETARARQTDIPTIEQVYAWGTSKKA